FTYRRFTYRSSYRKPDALIQRIRPHVHHPPALDVDVDLHGVAGGVPVDAGRVALVGGRFVEASLGEGHVGRLGLGGEQQGKEAHSGPNGTPSQAERPALTHWTPGSLFVGISGPERRLVSEVVRWL